MPFVECVRGKVGRARLRCVALLIDALAWERVRPNKLMLWTDEWTKLSTLAS